MFFFLKNILPSVCLGMVWIQRMTYRKNNLENMTSGLKLWYDALSFFNPQNS